MKPFDIFRIKIVIVAFFLLILVDVTLFLLATNSFILFNYFLIGGWSFDIILFIAVSYLIRRYRKTKQTPS